MSHPDTEFLTARGWDMSRSVDMCHMDCAEPGYRKSVTAVGQVWEIILCAADALVLERNAETEGTIDYAGALTPEDSKAGEWPWYPVQVAAAS